MFKILKIKIVYFIYILLSNFSTFYAQNHLELIPKKGLLITTNEINWAMGSGVNFYKREDKSHKYIFSWWDQDVIQHNHNHTKLAIGSNNTAIFGYISAIKDKNLVSTSINIDWNESYDGTYEIEHLKVWWPYFRKAKWFDGRGNKIKDLKNFKGKKLIVESNFGDFMFISNHEFELDFKIENLIPKNKYDSRDQFLIFKENSKIISKNEKLKRQFNIVELKNKKHTSNQSIKFRNKLSKYDSVYIVPKTKILPTPKNINFYDGNIKLNKINKNLNFAENLLVERLKYKFDFNENFYLQLTSIQDPLLGQEHYKIKPTEKGFIIKHNSIEGLNYAIETLISVSSLNESGVVFPIFEVEDYPSIDWRGIHMFTGPKSWMFHKQMYTNVLFPLKVNKIILQCEQAKWLAFPQIHNSISISLEDLKIEFEFLTRNNVEPIPLIQSLGHMEWFFKPHSMRRLSLNPDYPYTLNPFLDEAQNAIKSIWKEAVDLLNPSTIHFGLDEIGMIGYNKDKNNLLEIFKKQISFLDEFAKNENLKFMIWGDMGLAPEDAIDATNGLNNSFARQIRKSIPEGVYITDWHYKPSLKKSDFSSSLKIWKENSNLPIASTWFNPKNIYGFNQAAIEEGYGTLQTTWADFESSEGNMLKNIEQFGAYILSLDYSWSGKKTIPGELEYDPVLEWVNRFYNQPIPINGLNSYELTKNFNFCDISDEKVRSSFSHKIIELDKIANVDGIQIDGNTNKILPEGSLVAEIIFFKNNIEKYTFQIKYGTEIRSLNDYRPLYSSLTKSKINLMTNLIQCTSTDKIIIKQINPAAGLNLNQLSILTKR
ncbi:MAG: hypothetical protein P8H63_04315 [Flavobacteriaceae bacterium]|nr:hypothetical protein [Flavobacteriaceae bacterium]